MIYCLYLILAVAVVLLSVRLSYYVDCLDRKTSLSGAFIGGIMLAAITSLPELFSSITAIIHLDQPSLVQGNTLGSNILNLCIIASLLIIFHKQYQKAQLSSTHKTTIILGIIMYILVIISIQFPMIIQLGYLQFNLLTLILLLIYILNLKQMSSDSDEPDKSEYEIKLSVKQILIRFVSIGIALIIVSILLTQITDIIAEKLQLGVTVSGAIFLGIATSLPELSSAIALIKINNYDAAFGNIAGSNLFNFMVLCLSDFIYTKGSIYVYDPQLQYLLGFGILAMLCTLGLYFSNKKSWLVILCGLLILSTYLLSILLSLS